MSFVLAAAALLSSSCIAIKPYGHAFETPEDFSPAQYAFIAANFPMFTVEKRHASALYGNPSAPATSPYRYNSIAASVGTARKIKLLNPAARVLLYWNCALHYNMYECETEVQRSWLIDAGGQKQLLYNYSVADFRAWWVSCAVGALRNSSGALDGLFIDAVPKLSRFQDNPAAKVYAQLGAMLDEIRLAVPRAFVMFNGNFIDPGGNVLANATLMLPHADAVYAESMATLDTSVAAMNPARSIAYLNFLAETSAAAAPAGKQFFAHGSLDPTDVNRSFTFGLAVYLLVTPDPATGWFLANDGYSVNQGLMVSHPEYALEYGAPRGPFSVNGTVLSRTFDNATVAVDLKNRNATIVIGQPYPRSSTPSLSPSRTSIGPLYSLSSTPSLSPSRTSIGPFYSMSPTPSPSPSRTSASTAASFELTVGAYVGITLGVLFMAGLAGGLITLSVRRMQAKRRAVYTTKDIHTSPRGDGSAIVVTFNPLVMGRGSVIN